MLRLGRASGCGSAALILRGCEIEVLVSRRCSSQVTPWLTLGLRGIGRLVRYELLVCMTYVSFFVCVFLLLGISTSLFERLGILPRLFACGYLSPFCRCSRSLHETSKQITRVQE